MNSKSLGVKEYGESDFVDVARYLWTNIGLKTSLAPIQSLMFAGVNEDIPLSALHLHLARQITKNRKSVLLIDLDRVANNFKKRLLQNQPATTQPNVGITDVCYKIYEEPFLTTNVSDYGFMDLLFLFFFKARSGSLNFVSVDNDPVKIILQKGYPVEISSGRGTKSVTQHPVHLYDAFLAKELHFLSEQKYLSFYFTENAGDTSGFTNLQFPSTPLFLQSRLREDGCILKMIDDHCGIIEDGFAFLPLGQFRLKGATFAKRFRQILPLLKQKFDFILVNAPPFSDGSTAIEVAPTLDGTVVVLQSGQVERRHFRTLLSDLKQSKINLIGTVFNHAN